MIRCKHSIVKSERVCCGLVKTYLYCELKKKYVGKGICEDCSEFEVFT